MSALNINRNMSDLQLKQALNQITSAAGTAYASPTPEAHTKSKFCSVFSTFCIWHFNHRPAFSLYEKH